ncbi:ATP-binding protein [Salinactinospora qingdaonensis]|uniref:ATP-binding protein n=1 Tax=Salinactinospora qingdaonensis TaxID=702744 RepID=A0ABP7G333_9ACTN
MVVTGARTVGKSTLLANYAKTHGVEVTDLDDVETFQVVSDNPATFVSGNAEPVCIDEFQHAPELLSAIKAELNRDLRPGRYLLTGSTRYDMLPRASQSLTGRVHVMTLWPLSQGELRGERETFLDQLLTAPENLLGPTRSTFTRADYEQVILAGGFPIAVNRSAPADRRRWFSDFVERVIERDVMEIRRVRQRGALPTVLRALASRTGGVLNASAIASDLGMEARTVGDFITLLESVFLVHRLEAFSRTLSTRVGRSPKVHLVDSGLACHLMGITERKLARRRPATLTEFGHAVKTFVVDEILKQGGWAQESVRFSHLRTRDQHEVDLVIETDEGLVAGIEVKAAEKVSDADFRGLRMLRDRLGEDFIGGAVINMGRYRYQYDERLFVFPLDTVWSSEPIREAAPDS